MKGVSWVLQQHKDYKQRRIESFFDSLAILLLFPLDRVHTLHAVIIIFTHLLVNKAFFVAHKHEQLAVGHYGMYYRALLSVVCFLLVRSGDRTIEPIASTRWPYSKLLILANRWFNQIEVRLTTNCKSPILIRHELHLSRVPRFRGNVRHTTWIKSLHQFNRYIAAPHGTAIPTNTGPNHYLPTVSPATSQCSESYYSLFHVDETQDRSKDVRAFEAF